MSSRPGQWELLDLSKDPVPADRADVDRVARDFETNSTTMTSASRALQRIAGGHGWTGKAAESFAGEADETYGDLDKAASKYTDAAVALRTYAGHVETAREETARALQDAEQAHAARLSNQTSALEGVDDPTDAQKEADGRRQERLDAAVSAMGDARTRLNHAMETLETRASQCSNDIKDASENFKDSRMDDVKGAVSSVLKVVVNALSIIAVVVAVVIIFLVLFTSVVIAPIVFLGVLALGGVIFALTTVQYFMGDATGGDVAWAALGFAGGGVARVAGASVKALTGAARVSMIARSGRQAARALPRSVKFGRFAPFKPIRTWAAGRRANAVDEAMAQTRQAIDGTAIDSRTLRVLGLEDVVNQRRAIEAMRGMDPGLINSIRLSAASTGNTVAGVGAGVQIPAQGRSFGQFKGTLEGFSDAWGDVKIDVGDIADGQPDRTVSVPDLPDPLPTRIAPAGR